MSSIVPAAVRCGRCGRTQFLARPIHDAGARASRPPLRLDLSDGTECGLLGAGFQRCRGCGYVATNLRLSPSPALSTFMNSPVATALAGAHRQDYEALELMGEWADVSGNASQAAQAYLRAAWALDNVLQRMQRANEADAAAVPHVRGYARDMRMRALERIDLCLERNQPQYEPAVLGEAVACDLLRRARRFDVSRSRAQAALILHRFSSEAELVVRDMLHLQIRLCDAGDDGSHMVGEAVRLAPDFAARQTRCKAHATFAMAGAGKSRVQFRTEQRLIRETLDAATAPDQLMNVAWRHVRGARSAAIDALATNDFERLKSALDLLPLPGYIRTIMLANVAAYQWPVAALLPALIRALTRVEPAFKVQADECLMRLGRAGSEGDAVAEYLSLCLRGTTVHGWHYRAPASGAGDELQPPRFARASR